MTDTTQIPANVSLPLHGIRVVEFTHMVMGPTCGMILGDLGAEVIKVEPLDGDKTRQLIGLGAGFFRTFNRNKQSIAVDLKSPEGMEIVRKLVATADIVSENFRPGLMDEMGLGYAALRQTNPGLIYVSHKGFLPGPYENRAALDEVVQMMGGLAYMTGPPGRPLRAGTSVNDIMGGMFGVIGILAALLERKGTGQGQLVQSGLFENCVFLSAQHMQQFAVNGEDPMPMPVRKTTFGVYDVFDTADGGPQIFIGAVSDTQWKTLCRAFDLTELAADPTLQSNNDRVRARDAFMPKLREIIARHSFEHLYKTLEANRLPFAPVNRPQDLFQDEHLLHGGLGKVRTESGDSTLIPMLPVLLGDRRLGDNASVPSIGDSTESVLRQLGYSAAQIDALVASRSVGIAAPAATAR